MKLFLCHFKSVSSENGSQLSYQTIDLIAHKFPWTKIVLQVLI